MNDAHTALKELYALLVEYDLNTQLEEEAKAHSADEYARVVGILEGVKLVLGRLLAKRRME